MLSASLGVLRHVASAAGGVLVARGLIDEGTANELVGAVMVIVPIVWSVLQKKGVVK